ncbi:M1 family metallopeptidase [Anaeromyxobacter diazotrophicus]|uniref:Aminopeptidase n=1 Tax=Anaeromyxobacter diazotrophicus TaxID=2590199 RepID=A0A7I9VLP2_9BACT|nr:M1 family metallopeptidase [Anaeromyxobacter diazotrophicus]GEJ57029.1 aminopeptidase [Anaeromyxobacter diazotrophicus]
MPHATDDRNYRLPTSVRPARYQLTLSLDPGRRVFAGEGQVGLELAAPTGELVLHAAALDLTRAELRTADGPRAVRVVPAPASETVRLVLERPAPAGAATLELAWNGHVSDGLRGLYQAAGVAVTQFEAADARRVFPCFDEPGFKAPWALTVEAPAGLALLSNGAPERTTEAAGRQRVAFRETPPLPTYLVALACGALEARPAGAARGVPVRTWAVPEKLALTAFAQEVALEVLPRLEDYFGLPYAFGKLDQVGVPEFEAGAMENAGLVTYREAALLLDPATAALPVKKRVAEVITHELAHQWFGNWVTMQWWDDLWLNESFATWMAAKIVDGWRPEWRVWLDFDAGKAAALHLDALRSTHPVRAEVKNPEDMTESFDVITYEKGGAVLRMIEGYLGEGPFRDGIRLYMRRHAKANAVAGQLWAALAEASGQPVPELADAWIGGPGYPVVEVRREGRRVALGQRRFYSEPGVAEAGERWPVPLVLRYEDAGGVKEARHLLRGAAGELTLPGEGEVRWLVANGGSTGFYRVAYDAASAAALARHLPRLAPSERIGLIADQWALVRAGAREPADFLDLLAAFGGEEDYAVLDELVGRLAGLEARLADEPVRQRFQRFVANLVGPAFARAGWDPAPGEPDALRMRRAALLRALALVAREPAAVAEGARRLDRFLGGDAAALEPNLHDAAVAMAARAGDERRFEALRARFKVEPDPALKRRYLTGLALFEDPALAARAEALAFGDEIPLQDAASYMGALLANRTAREGFWGALRQRWDAVQQRVGGAPMLLRRVVEAVGQLPERRHLEEATAFFAAHPVPAARQAIAQTLERMRQDVALWERLGPAVARWLAAR